MTDISTAATAFADPAFRAALARLVNLANDATAHLQQRSANDPDGVTLATQLGEAIKAVDAVAENTLEDLAEPPIRQTQRFTVFIQQADGHGTTHISVHSVVDADTAIQKALEQTGADWCVRDTTDLRVLGVVNGDVSVQRWDPWAE
ncbi:hypothetical protein IMW82_13375 [Rhodanobacter sp. B2A1Ga4]|uniref:hypothetical protein n=1 Tax=Rhodanobacter sp. B2A1Ga4 TaxID=2778647 RepID=UPI001B37B8C0|nr:hypothetical protein [Rhodanobacter sp. B2A1Ga4]MBQ4855663.1 hypothetical protein [Rhodanobacter sp. B2A1Ga4]